MARPRGGERLIAENRRARHEYELLERMEAGLVLQGTEVKALREGRATLQRAFADVRGDEVWLVGANIASYDKGGIDVPKGYLYFAMAFSLFVEMLNLKAGHRAPPVHLRQPYASTSEHAP